MSGPLADMIKKAGEIARAKFHSDQKLRECEAEQRKNRFHLELKNALEKGTFPQTIDVRKMGIRDVENIKTLLEDEGFCVKMDNDTDGPLHYLDKMIITHFSPKKTEQSKNEQ